MQTATETKKSKSKPPKAVKAKSKKEVKTKTVKAVVVTTPAHASATEIKEARERIAAARGCLVEMHKNWFLFAKHMKSIRDSKDEEKLKMESFKKLCEREFSSIDYTYITKVILVVEKMGPEIERRLKSADYLVPNAEACYYLTSLKRINPDGSILTKIPETEYDKLQKELLDSGVGMPKRKDRIGYVAFRARIKELIDGAKTKLRAEINEETERWAEEEQKKLSKELEENGIEDEDEMIDEDDFEETVDEVDLDETEEEGDEVEEDGEEKISAAALTHHVEFLIENTPSFVEGLEVIDGKTRDFLKKVKKLQMILNETVEALSGN